MIGRILSAYSMNESNLDDMEISERVRIKRNIRKDFEINSEADSEMPNAWKI